MKNNKKVSLLLAALMIAATVLLTGCGSDSGDASSTSTAESADVEAEPPVEEGLLLPYEVDEGKLIINSVFSSDINNPDYNDEYAEGVASVEFTNASDEYLQSAVFAVTMADGTVLNFEATDVPAGVTAWIFESKNQTIDLQQSVEEITCDAAYGDYDSSVMEQVGVELSDGAITITNTSEETLTNVYVVCHADMGEAYYGGTAYKFEIDSLSGGQSETIDTSEIDMPIAVIAITQEE